MKCLGACQKNVLRPARALTRRLHGGLGPSRWSLGSALRRQMANGLGAATRRLADAQGPLGICGSKNVEHFFCA